MKLTKLQLKQIIKEEMEQVMREIEQEPAQASGGVEYDEAAAEAELQAKMAEPMTKAR